MKVMKYSYQSLASIFMGPYTSIYTNSNKSLALLPLDEKGLLVILPSRQDSQTGIGSSTSEGKIPSFASLSILFRLMWPSLRCQIFVGLDEGNFLFS